MTIAVQRFPKPSRTLQAHSPANISATASPTGADDMGMPLPTQSGAKPRSGSRKRPKAKTCRVCKSTFQPTRAVQPTCTNFECRLEYGLQAVAKAKAARARKEATAHREAKVKAKTRQQWMKEAQAAVNAYVRARDASLGCVSCDKPASWDGQWHASHFRSVGAASSVRFNLWNIHKSCSVCNNFKSGNLGEYAPRLRAKIGDEKVDWIYAQNTPVTYSIEYLQRLKKVFTKKTKRLIARHGNGL